MHLSKSIACLVCLTLVGLAHGQFIKRFLTDGKAQWVSTWGKHQSRSGAAYKALYQPFERQRLELDYLMLTQTGNVGDKIYTGLGLSWPEDSKIAVIGGWTAHWHHLTRFSEGAVTVGLKISW